MMAKMLCGLEAKVLEGEEMERVQRRYSFLKNGAIMVQSVKSFLPYMYLEHEDVIYNFKYRPSDIVVLGYPRSGTTWLQEIVWAMLNNPDSENKKLDIPSYVKVPWFEIDAMATVDHPYFTVVTQIDELPNFESPISGSMNSIFGRMENPRIFKSHMPRSMLHPKYLDSLKTIYIIRNPMDVFLSTYHFHRLFNYYKFDGSLEEFAEYFMNGEVPMGCLAGHIRDWWPHRHHPNLHVVFFEDLKNNALVEFKKMATFLGLNLTDEQHGNIISQLEFTSMKKRFDVLETEIAVQAFYSEKQFQENGGFCRKGKVGESKEKLSPEIYKRLAKHFEENLKDLDLPYDFST